MAEPELTPNARALIESVMRFQPRIVTDDYLEAARLERTREERRDRLRASGIASHFSDGDAHRGVPPDERMILDGTLRITHALTLARLWLARWKTGGRPMLWMGGPCGIGKTIAAAECIAECGGRYVSFQQLIRDTTQRERGIVKDAPATWARRYAAQCLVVLDEVGLEEERQKDAARIALYEFVEVRKRHATPTIVLTNKGSESLRQRFASNWYDKRTASRLKQVLHPDDETGKQFHDIGGDDMRGEL